MPVLRRDDLYYLGIVFVALKIHLNFSEYQRKR